MICHRLPTLLLLKTADIGPKTDTHHRFSFRMKNFGLGTFRTTLDHNICVLYCVPSTRFQMAQTHDDVLGRMLD
jgi:hypothetical protein